MWQENKKNIEREKEGRSDRTTPPPSPLHVRCAPPSCGPSALPPPSDAASLPFPSSSLPLITLLSSRLHTASIHPHCCPPPASPTLSFSSEPLLPPPSSPPSGRSWLEGRNEGLCNSWLPMSKGELLLQPQKVNITEVLGRGERTCQRTQNFDFLPEAKERGGISGKQRRSEALGEFLELGAEPPCQALWCCWCPCWFCPREVMPGGSGKEDLTTR